MANDTVDTLNLLSLEQVPDPFFTEYADHYRIGVRNQLGMLLDDNTIAARILLAAGRGNPLEIPVLATHVAKLVDGVLHIRHRTAAEYADPEVVGTFPVERLPDPEDDYSDEDVAQKRMQDEKRVWAKDKIRAKRRNGPIPMDFVFPPQGRRILEPTEEMLKYERAGVHVPRRDPLPEDFLGGMMDDVQRESELAAKTFYGAERMLKEAMYAYECARLEVEEEQRAWNRVWADVESVAGKRVVDECIARATLRVNDAIPPDEVEGEMPDLNAQNQWKSRAAVPAVPVFPPTPVPRVHAPALAPRVQSPETVVPSLLPPINLGLATFGGNATSFDHGPFLKRRRDSDVGSNSDSDNESDARLPSRGSARKRSRGAAGSPVKRVPPELMALPSPPEKSQSIPPQFKVPQRQMTVMVGRRSATASASPRSSVLPSPHLPSAGFPPPDNYKVRGRQTSTKRSAGSRSVTRSASPPYQTLNGSTR